MKYLFLLLFAAFILLIGVPTSEAELGPDLALVGIYDHRSGDTGTRSVAISGNYAYIADGYSGLVIINIEDPANPTLAGTYFY